MPNKQITCPYCFEKFMDHEVHFRMQTIFSEHELDPKGEGRSFDEVETDSRFSSDEIRSQLELFNLREKFLPKKDWLYEDWWKEFGGTSETAIVSRDGRAPKVLPFDRPVYNPHNPQHANCFSGALKTNAEGMVYAVNDYFGRETDRRVCPHCHNPLPGAYGKYPVLFFSIIGITGAGKTVYLSQLCKYIEEQLSYLNISAIPTSPYADDYMRANPVIMGKGLPSGTPPEQLLQPLCFDLTYRRDSDNARVNRTIVFYDIAGENCVSAEGMKGFGKFVENAHGIILLIDPEEFRKDADVKKPSEVLTTIHKVYANKHPDKVSALPFAVSISKGDKLAAELQKNLDDIVFLPDPATGGYLSMFNARDYANIHRVILSYVRSNNNTLRNELYTKYDNHNYFLFSAIGTSTKKIEIDGNECETPAAPPVPKRIFEPLAWLLYKLGFIGSHGWVPEPKDWYCPCCGVPRRYNTFCPSCKINARNEWKCPKCGNETNKEERCAGNGRRKCKVTLTDLRKGKYR